MELTEEQIRRLDFYRFGLLQDCVTLLRFLKKEGISLDQLKNFVERRREYERVQEEIGRKRKEIWEKRVPKCPKCSRALKLRGIPIPRGRGNVFGWESCWFCDALDCLYEKYSTKPAQAQLAKYKLLQEEGGS